jgi:hypothetical protein
MRRLDEFARFWNDMRVRLPSTAWSWPLVAGTAGVLVIAVTGSSGVPVEARPGTVVTPVATHDACQGQTWPYLSDACLQRDRTAARPASGPSTEPTAPTKPEKSQVRVLSYEPEMAAAAVGATPWAPKDAPAFGSPPPQKRGAKRQRSRNLDESHTVTVRSGRRGRNARERVYVVPSDSAYRAYGYAPW